MYATDDDLRRARVGRRIRAAREALGLSQSTLGQDIGCDRREISRWERGEHEPRPGNLRRLAIRLHQTEAYFFSDDNGPPR